MKRLTALILAVIMLALVLSSCCSHSSSKEATCTEDQICEKCGAVMKKAKDHKANGKATCTTSSVCTVCGEVIEEAKGHTYPENFTCADGAKCTVCGETLVVAGTHTPGAAATCTTDQVCTVCGEVIIKAEGHKPDREASCTAPSTCTVCGEVIEEAKGHTPGAAATATTAQTCTVCGAVIVPAQNNTAGNSDVDWTYAEETTSGCHYEQSASSKYNNSKTVLCGGNYLMEYFGAKSTGNSGYASILSNFAAKYPNINVSCVIVPKCCSFHSPSDQTDQFENHKAYISATYAMMSGVTTVDAFGEMAEHRDEYLFYRTDHHWTSLGAYYASVAFCKANGITARALNSYETVINTGFLGTLYTTYWGSVKPTGIKGDYTVGHLPKANYTFTYSASASADAGTNNGTAINKNAKSYASMFICGDNPFTDIKTDNNTGRKLVIFKESYGNAFVPYMIDYFDEIIVIDCRYSTASLSAIISKYGITDALIINNIQAVSGQQGYLKSRLES